MKLLVLFSFLLATAHAQADLMCEFRINTIDGKSNNVVVKQQDGEKVRLEGQVGGYHISVDELFSKNQNNPTLLLEVKNETGLILQTVLPSPNKISGERSVRTVLQVAEGTLRATCLSKWE